MTILHHIQRVVARSRKKNAFSHFSRDDLLLAVAYWYGYACGQQSVENDFSAAVSHISDYMSEREQDHLCAMFTRWLPFIGLDAVPAHIRQHFFDYHKGE
ncbi:MAG: hypothetical protein ACLUUL_03485 [Gemmiger sp.]